MGVGVPVKTYSTGMYVRLAFAVAINVDPQLLIIDEILAVGDVTFQQKCLEKFVDFRNEGRTIVLVTHAMNSVRDMCDRAAWLEHGKLIDMGDPAELVEAYTERMLGPGSRTAAGATRRGSGEMIVDHVELFTNGDQTPVKRMRTGDNVRFRLHYSVGNRVPKPVIGISIERLGGAVITDPCTRDVGLLPETMSGRGTIDIDFTNVSLLPGTYDLHTAVTDFNKQHIYDHLHVAMRFDVMTGRPYESSGVVTLRPDWTVS